MIQVHQWLGDAEVEDKAKKHASGALVGFALIIGFIGWMALRNRF